MRPIEAIDKIVASSDYTKTSLALAMGHNKNYVSAYATRGLVPRVDTFARIIDPCGYDLIARNRESGDEIVIDYNYDDPTT